MIKISCKTLAMACAFGVFAYAPVSANVTTETANGTTTVTATNTQQTNIVQTITSGGTSTISISSISAPVGPAGGSGATAVSC